MLNNESYFNIFNRICNIEIISRNKIKVQENSYVFKKIIINLNHNNSEEIIN